MSTSAIYKERSKLYSLYNSALDNKIKTITVPAFTETIEKYISGSVLIYVFGYWKIKDAEEFINLVRQNHAVYYDNIIQHLISESRCNLKMKSKLKLLIELANQDNYQINYQKFVDLALADNSNLVKILKREADKKGYNFNFNTMNKTANSIKKLVKWANQKNQHLDLDIEKLIVDLLPRNMKLLEYYLELNKTYKQKLNFDKILDLMKDEDKFLLIKKYVPDDYEYETYPTEMVINLKEYANDELKSILHDLIKFCYNTTEIRYVTYKDRKYYNSTNQWYDRKEEPGDENRDYDPNMECENYDSDCDFDKIYPKKSDKVQYIIEYNKKLTNWNDDYVNTDLIRKILHIGPEKVLLTGLDFISVDNHRGVNPDHRGSDHCKIYLECYDTFRMGCPIDLLTFANNLYRIKSHKWDKWYELFCGVVLINNKDSLRIIMEFDHGS